MASKSIEERFTVEEMNRLEADLPDLNTWSSQVLVPFRACRLRNPRVVWLNRRWFHERHVYLHQEQERERLSDWIIKSFAYIVPADADRAHVLQSDTRELYADRYGSSAGVSVHGGSGRVAVSGKFQVKGIGQTPLVGRGAPPGHSHGRMSLAEAVREAVFAEIAAAEFPGGSLPIIAIIDTGLNFSSPNPEDRHDQNVPRALVVRPTAIRIAHAERAPLFKDSVMGFRNSQSNDAARTREMVDSWMERAAGPSRRPEREILQSLLAAIVEQIAFGQVHRLFSGGYFSSNLTLSGSLLDFGNMHALPDWSQSQVHSVVEGFGQEMPLLRHLVNSIAFYVTKYRNCGDGIQLGKTLYDEAHARYQDVWKRYCLSLFQGDLLPQVAQQAIYRSIRAYYSQQQRRRVKYRFGDLVTESRPGGGWLHPAIVAADCSQPAEMAVLREINETLRVHAPSDIRVAAWYTAARLLAPRNNLDRRKVIAEISELAEQVRYTHAPDSIQVYIESAVDQGRRHWPNLPTGCAVLAHVTREGSSALLVKNPTSSVWLEGITGKEGTLLFFDERITEAQARDLRIKRAGIHWSAMVKSEERNGTLWVRAGTSEIRLPPMTIFYRPPAGEWLSAQSHL